jgi:hypothetical protein
MVCPMAGCGIPIRHEVVRGCTKDLALKLGDPSLSETYEKYVQFKSDSYLEEVR